MLFFCPIKDFYLEINKDIKMKVFYNLQRCVGFLVLFSILLAACVNHISEEEEAGVVVNDGNIPLKIIADIHEVANTRVANNTFEKGDEVGLFALAGLSGYLAAISLNRSMKVFPACSGISSI